MTRSFAILPKQTISSDQKVKQGISDQKGVKTALFGEFLQKTNQQQNGNQSQTIIKNSQNRPQDVLIQSIISANPSGTDGKKINAILNQLQQLLTKLDSVSNQTSSDGLVNSLKTVQGLLSKLKTALSAAAGADSKEKLNVLKKDSSVKTEDILSQLNQWAEGTQLIFSNLIRIVEENAKLDNPSSATGQNSVVQPLQALAANDAQAVKQKAEKAIGQLTTILNSTDSEKSSFILVQRKEVGKASGSATSKSSGVGLQTHTSEVKDSKNELKQNDQLQTNVFQSGPMNKLAQLSFRQPVQATPVNEQLLQQITDYLGKNGMQSFKNGAQEMTVKLHPDYLGEVTITLTQDQDGIMAKIIAAQPVTKDLIQSQLQQLNQGLQSQQIPVHKIEVSQVVYNGQQQAFNQQQQDSEQQQFEQQNQPREEFTDDNTPSFEDWLSGEV